MFPHNNEGRDELLSTYDTESLSEIANHGCKSGVCSEHIYYGDTITFFDKYEAEILDLIHIRYGSDTLVDIFKQHDACYDAYRNDCCWLFIENVAQDVIQTLENEQLSEDEMIESYMQPVDNYTSDLFNGELQQSAEDLMNLSVYNPPNSMTLNRYSQS
tara:strand:+ start:1056 stop:1532 length:477 start_codon:yes stop_codon:yes gene_type:complete